MFNKNTSRFNAVGENSHGRSPISDLGLPTRQGILYSAIAFTKYEKSSSFFPVETTAIL